MYAVRTSDTHRIISRHRTIERAAARWQEEYWGSDPATYRQVEVVDSNGDRVSNRELSDVAAAVAR